MFIKTKLKICIIITTFVFCILCIKNVNAQNSSKVYVRGDTSAYGMKIISSELNSSGFKIVTTGSVIEYKNSTGTIEIYQKIIKHRKIAVIKISKNDNTFKEILSNSDHFLLTSKDLNVGVYGDSTILFSSNIGNMTIKIHGLFEPLYKGQLGNELIIADKKGGIAIFPKRKSSGVDISFQSFNSKDWSVDYELKLDNLISISSFPPKPFDYEKSFYLKIVHTGGCTDRENDISLGYLPPDSVIEEWSKYVNVIAIHGTGFYPGHNSFRKSKYIFPERSPGTWTFAGPYIPKKPNELHRLIDKTHQLKMKVVCYTSPFYHYDTPNVESYIQDIKNLLKQYDIDGIYIDTMYMDKKFTGGDIICDKIANWELMRRVREILGPNKLIYYHGSSDKSPVASVPNIDAICDIVMYGEDVYFSDFNDKYIQFQVRKYGMSNSIGMLKSNKKDISITNNQVVDNMLLMNNRARWIAYPVDNDDGCVWSIKPPKYMLDYYSKLKIQKNKYLIKPLNIMIIDEK